MDDLTNDVRTKEGIIEKEASFKFVIPSCRTEFENFKMGAVRPILTALFLCLTIHCGIVETASGAAVGFGPKTASGSPELNPDIYTYELGSLGLEPYWFDEVIHYDPATGVLYYVRQNPWSRFDPNGLSDAEIWEKNRNSGRQLGPGDRGFDGAIGRTRYVDGQKMASDKLHDIPVSSMQKAKIHGDVAVWVDKLRGTSRHGHGNAGHTYYNDMINLDLPGVIEEMRAEGLDVSRGQSLTQAESKHLAEELIRRTVNDSKNSYVQWFRKATRTKTQQWIAKYAPQHEAASRLSRGEQLQSTLKGRLKTSYTAGAKGAGRFLSVMDSYHAVKGFGESLYYDTTQGQNDVMAGEIAIGLLPPDRNPNYIQRVWSNLSGDLWPYYSPERRDTLRQIHADIRDGLDFQSFLQGGIPVY